MADEVMLFGHPVPKKLYEVAERAGAVRTRTAFRKAVKDGLFARADKDIENLAQVIAQWVRPRRKPTAKQLARMNSNEDQRPLVRQLLRNLKKKMPALVGLYGEATDHWVYEDAVYRYYHGSFKVYRLQGMTLKIVEMLKSLQPKCELNTDFSEIVAEGTGKVFHLNHNRNWSKHTRPILEAFFHAKFMLEMMMKYGAELEKAPSVIPSGWGGVLYLYGLR
jgi:hypothetical protein